VERVSEMTQTTQVPGFDAVNKDLQEELGADENVKALFHQLGYLDRSNELVFAPKTASGSRLGTLCKKVIVKMCSFLFAPVITQQNRINLQVASCLREQLHQINTLSAECSRLKRENEVLSAQLGKNQEQGGKL